MKVTGVLLTLGSFCFASTNAFTATPFLSRAAATKTATNAGKPAPLSSTMKEGANENICPLLDPPADPAATFEVACGWFWSPQRSYDNVDVEGVLETVVGYTGSAEPKANLNPTYQNIQDYAEALRITFDPNKVSYQELLAMMFAFATPADPRFTKGRQYRFAIFYHTSEQKKMAEHFLEVRGRVGSWVSVEPASDFYRAEEYHQKYIEKQITQMYS